MSSDGEISEQIEQETHSLLSYFENIDWQSMAANLIVTVLRIITFVVIILIIYRIAKYGLKLFFRRYEINGKLPNRFNTIYSVSNHILTAVCWFLIIYTSLDIIGVPVGSLLAGAGVIGLAVSLGAQGFVNDIISGMTILLGKQMSIGDEITIQGITGRVQQVKLTTTEILDFDGTVHFIPNREISVVSNRSIADMRIGIELSLNLDTNLDKARAIILATNEQLYQEFSDSITQKVDQINFVPTSTDGRVAARIILFTKPGKQTTIESRAIELYLKAFKEAGITVPGLVQTESS